MKLCFTKLTSNEGRFSKLQPYFSHLYLLAETSEKCSSFKSRNTSFQFEQLGSLFDSGNLCSSFTTHRESLIVGIKYVGDLNIVITEMQSLLVCLCVHHAIDAHMSVIV